MVDECETMRVGQSGWRVRVKVRGWVRVVRVRKRVS